MNPRALIASFFVLSLLASELDVAGSAGCEPAQYDRKWVSVDDGTPNPCHSHLSSVSVVSDSDAWAV